jgi:hypothetical protein
MSGAILTYQPGWGQPRNHMKLEAHRGWLHGCWYTYLGISPVGISHRNHMKREAQAGRVQEAQMTGSKEDYSISPRPAPAVRLRVVHNVLPRAEDATTSRVLRAE